LPIADAEHLVASRHDDTGRGLATYRRLAMRNRSVALLRLAVPVLGVLVLLGMLGQIYLSSLASRFGIGRIAVTPERISVEAPEYTGLLSDGSSYRVWATGAEAAITSPDQIVLQNAAFSLVRTNGVTMQANAAEAVLDMATQQVMIAGETRVEDSSGTGGTLHQSVLDLAAQTLTTTGPVVIDYADGTRIEAQGLFYDTQALVWTFRGAAVTLVNTPGAESREIPSP